MNALKSTQAYKNSFFIHAEEHKEQAELRVLLHEWYPVTQAFCLSLPGYSGLFANAISNASSLPEKTALEQAFLVVQEITAGEFGMGKRGVDGIHYRMFARLGEPLGITLDELQTHPDGQLPETQALVRGIRRSLGDLYHGAGCIRVVEGTAFNIVEAMDHLFKDRTREDGSPLFTEHQYEYITLHLWLEKEHDEITEDFMDKVVWNKATARRMEEGLTEMATLFGEYWEALSRRVFPVLAS